MLSSATAKIAFAHYPKTVGHSLVAWFPEVFPDAACVEPPVEYTISHLPVRESLERLELVNRLVSSSWTCGGISPGMKRRAAASRCGANEPTGAAGRASMNGVVWRRMVPVVFAIVAVSIGSGVAVGGPAPEERRPRLQIINGTDEPVTVTWLADDGRRVPQGTVAAGGDTVITTTIGHRFAIAGGGADGETIITSKIPIQAFLVGGVPAFYTQRVEVGGFPIVASERVNPFALEEAAHLVGLMIAKRADILEALVASGARMNLLAWNEFTTSQPEFKRFTENPAPGFPGLSGQDYWDARARGTGGSETDPFCTAAEENLLAYPGDPYATECILIHEFAHMIHLRGMNNIDPTFDHRVRKAYQDALARGLWKGTYASVNHYEYFAEGVQSWFDDNRVNDHDHNHVHLRSQLVEYDPGLAALCREVFGETELTYTKPTARLSGHLEGYDPSRAPTFVWPERLTEAKRLIHEQAQARGKE